MKCRKVQQPAAATWLRKLIGNIGAKFNQLLGHKNTFSLVTYQQLWPSHWPFIFSNCIQHLKRWRISENSLSSSNTGNNGECFPSVHSVCPAHCLSGRGTLVCDWPLINLHNNECFPQRSLYHREKDRNQNNPMNNC